jgi:hypothetical protein
VSHHTNLVGLDLCKVRIAALLCSKGNLDRYNIGAATFACSHDILEAIFVNILKNT